MRVARSLFYLAPIFKPTAIILYQRRTSQIFTLPKYSRNRRKSRVLSSRTVALKCFKLILLNLVSTRRWCPKRTEFVWKRSFQERFRAPHQAVDVLDVSLCVPWLLIGSADVQVYTFGAGNTERSPGEGGPFSVRVAVKLVS